MPPVRGGSEAPPPHPTHPHPVLVSEPCGPLKHGTQRVQVGLGLGPCSGRHVCSAGPGRGLWENSHEPISPSGAGLWDSGGTFVCGCLQAVTTFTQVHWKRLAMAQLSELGAFAAQQEPWCWQVTHEKSGRHRPWQRKCAGPASRAQRPLFPSLSPVCLCTPLLVISSQRSTAARVTWPSWREAR